MDDWLSSAGGPGPTDGAFERFLTAALAAIITLVFSWRLLGEVSESEREEALRRHVAARASGQYKPGSLGISDEKLKEVAQAFVEDRSRRLQTRASANEVIPDGSCVDSPADSSAGVNGDNRPVALSTDDTLSRELTTDDRQFIESLLKSSHVDSVVGELDLPRGVGSRKSGLSAGYVEHGHLLAAQEFLPSPRAVISSGHNTQSNTLPSRITDSSQSVQSPFYCEASEGTRYNNEHGASGEAPKSPTSAGTVLVIDDQFTPMRAATTLSDDSDDDDDFQNYFDDDIEPRELDSDEETYYRTFLEPIQEEMSGDDQGSSSDEWCDPGDAEDSDDSRSATPQPAETADITPPALGKSNGDTEPEITEHTELEITENTEPEIADTERKYVLGVENESFSSESPSVLCSVKCVSEPRVFESYNTSPEHKMSVISDPEDCELADDSVSETSEDTVIMVFSNSKDSDGNGMEQSQKEIVFLDQERYDGYRDMFLTEKIDETDSDDDIITTSKRYDSIRNNLTLIGSDDGESLSPCYDDYERGSWSDPDDNFRCSIPQYNNNKYDNRTSFTDDSLPWKSKTNANSHRPDVDFDFGQNLPKGYRDAPYSNATESTPVGFTFVEIKDSFTEFSLRNYVRDKEHFDPKSDSGIFTDGEEFTVSGSGIKPSESLGEILARNDRSLNNLSDGITAVDNTGSNCEHSEGKPALSIDSAEHSADQYGRPTSDNVPGEGFSVDEGGLNQSELNATNSLTHLSRTSASSPSVLHADTQADLHQSKMDTDQTNDASRTPTQGRDPKFEELHVDTDSIIDEAFAFAVDSPLERGENSGGSGEHWQTMATSGDLKTLRQTEVTCWSAHTQEHSDINTNAGQDAALKREREVSSYLTAKLKSDHLEHLRPSSPIFRPAYYSDRQRRVHNEAILLDQNAAVEDECSSTDIWINSMKQNDESNSKNTSDQPNSRSVGDSVHGEPAGGNLLSAIPVSTISAASQPAIPGEQMHITRANDNHDQHINKSDNDPTIGSTDATTPRSVTSSPDTDDMVTITAEKPSQTDTDCSKLTDRSPEQLDEQSQKDKAAKNSVILEQSPVICLSVAQESSPASADLNDKPVSDSETRSTDLPGRSDGTRVSLPPRYTPSTEYRKLLKPTTPRRYTSVLQRPISTEKLHVNYRLPDKPVPKIRRKILASRQRFLSDENLLSPNDSFDDPFSEHILTERYQPRQPSSPTSPSNRQSYSVADISRLYASTLSDPPLRKPRPGIDQLHENCILSPERLALLRSKAFSTDSLPRRISRQPSVSSLVETDIDTGETSETPQFTETDVDVDFGLQAHPVEKTVSMMDLRSGRSRFVLRKKAAEERKKSRSLQQLGTNIGSLETDIDAPFPDGSGGVNRAPSEHELRVSKSLSKLNVPDWLRRSTVFRTGSHFILRRDSNASTISQWSSKSYGPLATTRDSSRASSCATLSQPSSVVIKTRVMPTSSSRLLSSPNLNSSPKPRLESKPVMLPSAKFREREKPSGLMPIPIVPFDKLRQKFEKKATGGASPCPTPPQPTKAVETKIIVEPSKNPPPGILKQTLPAPIIENCQTLETATVEFDNSKANKAPVVTPIKLPPPKITVTSEKSVSPKDKTSPSAFEKSVRFSPVLARMDMSTSLSRDQPDIPSPEADYKPLNGGTSTQKPALPPKPTKKMLKSKSSVTENNAPPPKSTKPKPATKPAPAEKPSRIANLIRRFKGKDDTSLEILGLGVPISTDASYGDPVFAFFQKQPSDDCDDSQETLHVQEGDVICCDPPTFSRGHFEHLSPVSSRGDSMVHAHDISSVCVDTVNCDDVPYVVSKNDASADVTTDVAAGMHTNTSEVSLHEVLGSLLALGNKSTNRDTNDSKGPVRSNSSSDSEY